MAPATQSCEFDSHQQKLPTIPVIDLSIFEEGKELSDECLKCLAEACEMGCFRVANHGIPDDLFQNTHKICRQVFQLPTHIKQKNVSTISYGGYLGPVPLHPLFESLGIVGVPDPKTVKDFSDLMWPQGNQKFCEIVDEYTTKMVELSQKIHEILLASWGVGKYYWSDFGYAPKFGHGFNVLRMNKYAMLESEMASESLGLEPHRDLNSLTLLLEDEIGGLQVMNKAGNWVDVESVPNTVVVFSGDALQAWSNDRIRSAKHRVMLKGRETRFTLTFFSTFREDKEIRTPAELVNDEHPQRYRTFQYGDLVKFKLSEEGRTWENHLEALAGIAKC